MQFSNQCVCPHVQYLRLPQFTHDSCALSGVWVCKRKTECLKWHFKYCCRP